MKNAVISVAAGTLLVLATADPAAAQRPGANADRLPPHIQAQLWPERELSPVEQELKDRVIVMRDTLTRVHATVSLLQRQERSGAGVGVVRSTARSLAGDCARGRRVGEGMAAFAATLSTDDAKWGEPTVRAFRAAVTELVTAMERCQSTQAGHAAAPTPDAAKVLADALATQETVLRYDRAEKDLIRTLKIRIEPKISGSPAPR